MAAHRPQSRPALATSWLPRHRRPLTQPTSCSAQQSSQQTPRSSSPARRKSRMPLHNLRYSPTPSRIPRMRPVGSATHPARCQPDRCSQPQFTTRVGLDNRRRSSLTPRHLASTTRSCRKHHHLFRAAKTSRHVRGTSSCRGTARAGPSCGTAAAASARLQHCSARCPRTAAPMAATRGALPSRLAEMRAVSTPSTCARTPTAAARARLRRERSCL